MTTTPTVEAKAVALLHAVGTHEISPYEAGKQMFQLIDELTTAHEAELKEAYALAEIIRQRTANEILDLIIKHDPSSFRPTSKEYWGNTLYAEIEARYLPQPPLSDVKE